MMRPASRSWRTSAVSLWCVLITAALVAPGVHGGVACMHWVAAWVHWVAAWVHWVAAACMHGVAAWVHWVAAWVHWVAARVHGGCRLDGPGLHSSLRRAAAWITWGYSPG